MIERMRPSRPAFSRFAPLLAVAIVMVGTWLAYAPALGGPFLFDDYDAIHPLAQIRAAGNSVADTLANAPAHIRTRWLANASFLANQALDGDALPPRPRGYKVGSLLVHLACGLALFALGARMARRWAASARRAQAIGALAAALFLLHPLLLSTVMYPVQRMAQLSTLFSLLAVLAYVHWREGVDSASPRRHVAGILAVLGATALAISGKESGVLVPLLILAVEFTAFGWPARGTPARGRFEAGFGLTCAAPLTLGFVLLATSWNRLVAGYALRDFSLPERLLTQVHALAGYLGQLLWPRIDRMGLMLDDIPVQRTLDGATLALTAAGLVLLVLAIALRRRAAPFSFAVFWFLAAHALESSVIPLEMAFEHRNYLALCGPAIAVAWAVARLPHAPAALLGAALLTALGTATWRRAQDWRSYPAWLAAEAEHHPGSLRAGTEYFFHLVESGQVAEAVAERERLLATHPGHAQPVMLKLAFACGGGPISVATMSDEDLAALRSGAIGKDAFHAYVGLRDAMQPRCAQPRWDDFARATRAIADNPAVAREDRPAAAWWRLNGDAHRRLQDWPGVTRALQQALQRQQDDPRDWVALMHASLLQGDRAGYAAARASLLRLTGGRLGSLAAEVQQLDRAATALPDAQEQP